MMNNAPDIEIPTDRLRTLSSELRAQSPHWADRLEQATTEQELRNLVCDLFNLSHALPSHRESANETTTLAGRITRFINENLHRGLTLKVLANFLGYSEKYCSDLFYRIMGESFSGYMRRHRVERAQSLLTTTAQTLLQRWGSAISLPSAISSNARPGILPGRFDPGRHTHGIG